MSVQVEIVMGSQSDWPTMKEAARILDDCRHALRSTHRLAIARPTGSGVWDRGGGARASGHHRGRGRGGARAVIASETRIPVIGVPILTKAATSPSSRCPEGYAAPLWPSGSRRVERGPDGRCDPRAVTLTSRSGWTRLAGGPVQTRSPRNRRMTDRLKPSDHRRLGGGQLGRMSSRRGRASRLSHPHLRAFRKPARAVTTASYGDAAA